MSDGNSDWQIVTGFPENLRNQAVDAYYEAFRGKLSRILGGDQRGKALFFRILNSDYAICAITSDGSRLLGIAGYKTADGSLAGGEFGDLVSIYGWMGAAWRAPLLSLLDRDIEPDHLLMDGIAVVPEARGKGVGTALLKQIVLEATRRQMLAVRLDVIDSNQRAQALYERFGFIAQHSEDSGPFKHIFGFERSTAMVLDLSNRPKGLN